ncbi:type IV pilin [Haloglomus litoreum]|uniref:type IV pilin n=1 Tax=Haloglomus litoreum TaxID=3034026 RepID=UPI0023E7CBE8|nr:type IV pilin [Haloglomus sp. DT116]
MPSRRQFLLSSAALGAMTLPGTAAAGSSRPTADVDAALDGFGSGAVSGRVAPRALPRIGEAATRVAAEAPEVADGVAGRLPTATDALAAPDGTLGALGEAPLHVETVAPAIDGVDALAVGIDFTTRGPVVRARVTGTDGAPSRAAALDALADAGLPVAALDPFAIADSDDLALYAGVADRDDEQPFILALLLVVLAAVVGTFVLGLGSSVGSSGGSSGSAREAPQVSFSFDYSADNQLVTIIHNGGDSVDASELQVVYESDGSTAVERWRDDDDGTVTAGDSFTTRRPIDSGATLRVVWQNSDGSGGAVLGAFEAP